MKSFCFNLTDELYKQASYPIRKKEEVISLMLNTIKLLITMPVKEENYSEFTHKVILYIDKMSRLFFVIENKIFSFNFPFLVTKDDITGVLKIRYRHIEIDSYISSLIISVFSEGDTFGMPFDNLKEFVRHHMIENGWEAAELDDVCEIIKNLIVFETGYLRYDHDKIHINGRLHPENHIDFFYASNNEIKIGIDAEVDSDWIIDFADVNTKCKFLKHN